MSIISPLLSGKQLKVAIAELGPSSQIYRNATGHVSGYGGILYEELSWLSQRLNFSLDMLPSKDNLIGDDIDKSGDWTGMIGQLQRQEVDLACAPLYGVRTFNILELAVFVVGDSFGIFVQYPTPKIKIDGPIRTFSLNVWVGLLISIVACIGFIHLLNFLARKYLVQTQYPTIAVINTWFYTFGTLANHSVNRNTRNSPRSVGLVAFTWLLATFFVINIYSSCMASYMSLRFQRPDISTFQDLANNPHYQPTTLKGGIAERIFLEAKQGIMRKIGDKLRQCTNASNECSLAKFDSMVERVLGENVVGILPVTVGEYYVKKTMSNRTCQLTIGQESMAFMNLFMGIPKNRPYAKELTKESLWWVSLGLQAYWTNKLTPTPRQCLLQYNNNGEDVKIVERARLKLEQFSVAFIVLFAGYVLAIIQFLRERFIRY